jgi:hypothetical protein
LLGNIYSKEKVFMNFLVQPKKYKSFMADEGSRAVMEKTIDFFENMGKKQLLDDYNSRSLPSCSPRKNMQTVIRTADGTRRETASTASYWRSMVWATGTVSR